MVKYKISEDYAYVRASLFGQRKAIISIVGLCTMEFIS